VANCDAFCRNQGAGAENKPGFYRVVLYQKDGKPPSLYGKLKGVIRGGAPLMFGFATRAARRSAAAHRWCHFGLRSEQSVPAMFAVLRPITTVRASPHFPGQVVFHLAGWKMPYATPAINRQPKRRPADHHNRPPDKQSLPPRYVDRCPTKAC